MYVEPNSPNLSNLLNRQQQRLQQQIDQRQHWSNRYSWARVIIFLIGLAISAITFYTAPLWVSGLMVLLTMTLFGIAVYLHQRVNGSLARFQMMRRVKHTHLARQQRDWDSLPSPLQQNLRYEHPFEADLDILGSRSLHRLLNTATTHQGSQRLHAWLTAESVPRAESIQARQRLVEELLPRTLLRDRLTVQGLLLNEEGGWQPDHLLEWLARHPTTVNLRPWVWGLGILAVINWLLFGAEQLELLGPLWRITLGLYAVLLFWHGQTIGATFDEAGAVQHDLAQLMQVFQRLERYNYQGAPNLQRLCAPFQDQAEGPSRHLRRIARIAAATGVQGNPMLALVLNALVPWGLYFAWQLGKEKQLLAELLPDWLDRWAEVETLSSLATDGYLNPGSTFPTILSRADAEAGAPHARLLQIDGLGHPLLPTADKVRNDFAFEEIGSVVILTGSNMAGKSTFLKALTLNLRLAYAGGLVDATQLTTIRLRLFTCIKVSDSVTDGISYFYAEVRRLKALLNALEAEDRLPLLYVIDEIFRGTNNRERLEGSRAYIRALASQAGVGLVATHDLELVQLAEELPLITNYHFRDDIVDGQMNFDYRLRPGPSPTTNALKIMQHAGLPVSVDG